MRSPKIILSLCGITGILILSGCASTYQKNAASNTALLEPSGITRFSDVPVPADFKLLPEDSYTFENSGVRVAVLKYRGKANAAQVISFYKEQMPVHNWNLLNITEYGSSLMNFDRENETCIVDLAPRGNNITLTLSLGPKSQITPKKLKQPLK